MEAATRDALEKKVFLQILQNLQKNICARVSFLIKLQARGYLFHGTPLGDYSIFNLFE